MRESATSILNGALTPNENMGPVDDPVFEPKLNDVPDELPVDEPVPNCSSQTSA